MSQATVLKLLRFLRRFPRYHVRPLRLLACCTCLSAATAAAAAMLPHWLRINIDDSIMAVISHSVNAPPKVLHDGIRVLHPVNAELQQCASKDKAKFSTSAGADLALSDVRTGSEPSLRGDDGTLGRHCANRRKAFVCAAGCSAREPQLEFSLAPWSEWEGTHSGLTMMKTLQGFCLGRQQRESKDPFIITVLWRGDVYFKACGAPDIWHAGLYLIGPEDLSLVAVFLLGTQRVAILPPGPIAFGMYLSDYTSLVDHHLVGPGLPMFAYLSRDTSWAIPWPSSFTVFSTKEVEDLQNKAVREPPGHEKTVTPQKPWRLKISQAYWIGAITGPWEFQMDAGLLAVPRLKLLRMAKEHPKELHAEWSSLASYGIAWVEDKSNVSGFFAPRSRSVEEITGVARADYKVVDQWMDYKYYMNLDGVVLGGRLNKLLALGGVVLQHQAGYMEHITGLVEPYEHYVPVAYDLSDLISKVDWLQRNDVEAQRIAERARSVASERMRLEDHICYIWRALEALGGKTASASVDATAVDKHLSDEGFKRATVIEGGMRPTLELFWGTKLEDVQTGRRRMDERGIVMLQWVWDRFEKLHAETQHARKKHQWARINQ